VAYTLFGLKAVRSLTFIKLIHFFIRDILMMADMGRYMRRLYSYLKIVSIDGTYSLLIWGHAVALLVEELCYKPAGRGFESR
jgi:hypothetical protein